MGTRDTEMMSATAKDQCRTDQVLRSEAHIAARSADADTITALRAELTALRVENERLGGDYQTARGANYTLLDKIERLRAEVERLRAALEFYADRENWKRPGDPYEDGRAYPPKANLDNGDKARAALEEKA